MPKIRNSTPPQPPPSDETRPVDDSSPIVNDPLRDIATNTSQNVGYESEEDIPIDIREFLDENGVSDRVYRCILKRVVEGGGDRARSPYVNSYANTFPSIPYIAREYGPGEYILVFQWRAIAPETNKLKCYGKELNVTVDESYRDEHEEYQLRKTVTRSERQKQLIHHARLKSELHSTLLGSGNTEEKVDAKEAGKKYLQEIVEAGTMLGLTRKGFDWEKVLAVAVPLIPALLDMFAKRQASDTDRIEKIYTMLLAQQSSSTERMLSFLQHQQGPASGADMMKEMRDMIFGAVDIKEALAGNKTTIADKIFDLVQGIAPQVLEIAMKGQSARETDYRYKMAQAYMENSPDFQKLRQNPQEQATFVNRMDAFFGWEQTDIILRVGGLTRPDTCPRRQDQQFPHGDPRNVQGSSQSAGATPGTVPVEATITTDSDEEGDDEPGA